MTTGDRILALLPATSAELCKELSVAHVTLYKWLTRLRAAKQIHIGEYRRTMGDFAPVFVRGRGKDARRPKPLTKAQIQARYRQSLRDLGLYEDVLADNRKRAARLSSSKQTYAADPLMSLLFKKPTEE